MVPERTRSALSPSVEQPPRTIDGSKRKRIQFVPESTYFETPVAATPAPSTRTRDLYLSVVFPSIRGSQGQESEAVVSVAEAARKTTPPQAASGSLETPPADSHFESSEAAGYRCSICGLTLSSEAGENPAHEASLAHQLALEHSHPPSALNRRRKGFQYLSSYGWDPDIKQGLGAHGEGLSNPIKAHLKEGRSGIGVDEEVLKIERRAREEKKKMREAEKRQVKRQKKRAELEHLSSGEKMQQLVFGRDDVNKYLGIEL